MRQVEVNGMLLEFDEKILLKQELRVGDPVQILIKSYSSYNLYKGVVTQILPFKEEKPVVEVMYIEESYNDFSVKTQILYAGSDTENEETRIIKSDGEYLPFTKERAIDMLDKEIANKEAELQKSRDKKEYFLKYFNMYFKDIVKDSKNE